MPSASDMMSAPQAAFISLLIQTSSAFSHFVFPLPLSGPTARRASAKVSESGYCLARHTNELPLKQPSRKANSFNCSTKRRGGDGWREALGWEMLYALWNLSASRAEAHEFICTPVSRSVKYIAFANVMKCVLALYERKWVRSDEIKKYKLIEMKKKRQSGVCAVWTTEQYVGFVIHFWLSGLNRLHIFQINKEGFTAGMPRPKLNCVTAKIQTPIPTKWYCPEFP